MDRMRDRLDKIARRSMSAPAGHGQSEAPQPMPLSNRPSQARPIIARQGKAPIPRLPASIPARPSSLPTSPRGRGAGGEVTPRVEKSHPSLDAPGGHPAASHGTPSPGRPTISRVGVPEGRPATSHVGAQPAAPVTPTGKRIPPADVRAADEPAPHPQADALDNDRILELPARVTVARRQRPAPVALDAVAARPPKPSDPTRLRPVPSSASSARPVRADVTADEPPPPPRALPAPAAPAKTQRAAGRSTSARPARSAATTAPAPATMEAHADVRASADNPLPENIEPMGSAMQRFMTVLAERRRQRAMSGGDGGEPPQPPESERICPVCGGAGYVRLDVPVGDPRFGQPVPCKCKEREFEERRRMEEERRVLELDRFFSLKPFGDKTFETFNPRVAGVKEAYEAAHTFAEDPTGAPFRWLVLMGGTGVGKTHLAASIAHERLEARSSVFFAVVPDLLDHLRAAFAPSAEMPYNEMFETVREVEMLILDDLGSENSTAWATEKLFQIINYRYNYRMPTVITTNSRLFEHMDERIASRLADTSLSRTVVIEAQSRRPQPARKQPPPARQAPPRW